VLRKVASTHLEVNPSASATSPLSENRFSNSIVPVAGMFTAPVTALVSVMTSRFPLLSDFVKVSQSAVDVKVTICPPPQLVMP